MKQWGNVLSVHMKSTIITDHKINLLFRKAFTLLGMLTETMFR